MTGVDDASSSLAGAIQAYNAAYLRLEGTIPGVSITEIDGLPLIRYGRAKGGVQHEVIAGNIAPEVALQVIGRHPELAAAFVSIFSTGQDDPEPVFVAAGYTRAVHNYLMRRDITEARTAKADDTIVRLMTVNEIEQLAALREDRQILPEYLNDFANRCYALVIDNVPAASAVLVVTGGDTAVVEYVHTLESYRRRGYGRWLMRALHREAAHAGARAVVLSSNETGRPLYEALGYELLCYEDVYRR